MTNSEQAEYFLRKFNRHGDINRPKVMILKKEFEVFDDRPGGPHGELEEDQAMRLLESRGEAHTLKEIRAMVESIDLDQNHKLSFLEWACAIFKKSWVDLHSDIAVEVVVGESAEELAARQKGLEAAGAGAEADVALAATAAEKEEVAKKEAALKAKLEADDMSKLQRKADIARAKKGPGAKDKAKMFGMMAEGETGMTVEEQVKAAAKQRREEKAAKKAAAEAAAAKQKAENEEAAAAAEEALQAEISRLKAVNEAEAEKMRIEAEEKAIYEVSYLPPPP